MGLIMLILGGTVPTVYALNLAVRYDEFQSFIRISQSMEQVVDSQTGSSTMPRLDASRELERFIESGEMSPSTLAALRQNITSVEKDVSSYGTMSRIPASLTDDVRKDMICLAKLCASWKNTKLSICRARTRPFSPAIATRWTAPGGSSRRG